MAENSGFGDRLPELISWPGNIRQVLSPASFVKIVIL